MSNKLRKYLFENDDGRPFQVFRRDYEAGISFPPHWHDFLELEIIVSGSLRHNYNNTIYSLLPGNAHIISYYDFHEISTLTDSVFYCIHFSRKFLDPKLAEYLSHNSVLCLFTEAELENIIQQLETLLENQKKGAPFEELYAQNVLSQIIIQMIRKKTNSTANHTSPPMQQAIAYIAENYQRKITLEDIARSISFSSGYLGKLFKKEMDSTFNDYLLNLRLKHACNLLSTTSTTVQNVAFQAGFGSVEYFMHSFKKRIGMTPSEYRKLFSEDSMRMA